MSEEKLKARIKIDRIHLIPLIICVLDTTMCRGEIFNLEWWQIDLKNRVIYLTKEAPKYIKTGGGGILLVTERLFNTFSRKRD